MSLSKSDLHVCHYELKTDKQFFTCEGCKMNGFGQRFNCKPCGHELHRECKNPKTDINHEFFGCSTLTFLEKPFTKVVDERSKQPEYSKFCDACGKDICGFSYHCLEPKRKLDLHPCCAKLKKKLPINGTVFNLTSKLSSECLRCHKTKNSIGNKKVSGWAYVSTCRTYKFHVYCMTEMVHEARLNHGNLALAKVDLKQLTKTKSNGGSKRTTFERIVKSFLSIIMSFLLGDPTIFISNAVVELVAGGK